MPTARTFAGKGSPLIPHYQIGEFRDDRSRQKGRPHRLCRKLLSLALEIDLFHSPPSYEESVGWIAASSEKAMILHPIQARTLRLITASSVFES